MSRWYDVRLAHRDGRREIVSVQANTRKSAVDRAYSRARRAGADLQGAVTVGPTPKERRPA